MRFHRSEGLTPSEKVLADLCDKSFLRLWTYPNLYKKPTKELIDLMVVFGEDVLLFSDKSCSYPDTGNSLLDWSRWYRRSITNSANQIEQAERWLRSYPQKVFLDAKCNVSIPIALPDPAIMRIHRVCVALGSAAKTYSHTGRRSLAVEPSVPNDSKQYTIGRTDCTSGWIHVFDEETVDTLLRELSTISDFIHYLNSKAALFDSRQFLFAESELDIMAYYLWNGRAFPATNGPFRLEPNLWQTVKENADFLRGRHENEVSYFWDNLIEHLTDHYLNESLELGNSLSVSDYEILVRIMAGEIRYFRRVLSKCILERADIAKNNAIASLLVSGQPNVNYVLYIGKGDQSGDYAAYRVDRSFQLKSRCIAAKAIKPELRYIVGIALDARGVKGSSEDFMFFDTGDWSALAVEKAAQLREELGYFIPGTVTETSVSEREYPTV